jgi:hypothetical protein
MTQILGTALIRLNSRWKKRTRNVLVTGTKSKMAKKKRRYSKNYCSKYQQVTKCDSVPPLVVYCLVAMYIILFKQVKGDIVK